MGLFDKIKKAFSGNKEKEEVVNYDKGLEYRDSYIYGIGGLFAIYMYEKYKEDKVSFKEELKRCFLEYPANSDINVFRNVGINYEDIKEGKVLKKILRDRWLEIGKRSHFM